MFRESPFKLNLPPSRPEKTAVLVCIKSFFTSDRISYLGYKAVLNVFRSLSNYLSSIA